MESTGNANGPSKSSGLLKTTTWGTLIAASILVAAWSFSGPDSNHSFGPNNPGAKLNPFHKTTLSKHVNGSTLATKQASESESASVVASAAQQPVNSSSSYSFIPQPAPFFGANAVAAHSSESKGQAAAGPKSDEPVLIAAKMAPDLVGLDPEKPVDVIVQYRNSPSSNALSDNGATTKVEFTM